MVIDKTEKILLIVESPNKVKTIANILKASGYSNITIMASVGHIMSLKDGGPAYNSGIYPNEQFKMNLQVLADKQKIVNDIASKANMFDKIYIMTDGDREGEIIAWSLLKFCKLQKEKCYRAITHEITTKAIISAIENPVSFNDKLVEAGFGRMMTDKLIGYGLSPIGKKYIGARSIGRCQTVGLKLISERETEIADFIPKLYFDLYLSFEKENMAFKAKYVGEINEKVDHFTRQVDVDAIVTDCKNSCFVVDSIKTLQHKEAPKPPFCTATFQQEAANKLGLRVKDAMSCAQRLFEGVKINGKPVGLITYLRTDSTTFSDEFVPELKRFINDKFGTGAFVPQRKAKKGIAAQNGHEALRVVNPWLTPEKLSTVLENSMLVKVYALIWQRTVAACMSEAQIVETEHIIKCKSHLFSFSTKSLASAGYKAIYGADDTKSIHTALNINDPLENCLLEPVKKFTQPKPRYTESSLVKELETRGIGRPSTYASIVETLLNPTRNYAFLDQKNIVPTDRGMQLAEYCSRAFPDIINLNYTKNMEQQLDRIAVGELDLQSYMESFYEKLKLAIENNTETGIEPEVETRICPKCKNNMILRRSKFGKLFYGCSAYPECNGILNLY